MPPIIVPSILDRVARAGRSGISYPAAGPDRRELELCQAMGFPLYVREGRVNLAFDNDHLIPTWIAEETPAAAWEKLQVEGYFETESTNAEALLRAGQGAPSGTLVYAECQTAGRGRMGRQWISPLGAGLYFSLVLRPEQPASCWALLAHVASVALVDALRELSDERFIPGPLDLELKWPNDLLISGKKAAGILLETASSGGAISAVVLGVGVNVKRASFPAELQNLATSVSEMAGVEVPRRHLMVRFLYYFQMGYRLFQQGEHEKILERWKTFSRMWKDMPVWIVENDKARPAVTVGLAKSGALLVRNPDGSEEVVLAGDISIRRS